MNTGHEDLKCETCHTPAKGTLLQQLQSNVQHFIGLRKSAVQFGTHNVDSKKCQECHIRYNDRHPVHRFLEPRFKDKIKEIDATQCETCHLEHSELRITQTSLMFCINCHQDLEVKNDPLDISHAELIKQKEWVTCSQCHDFHGNHIYNAPTLMKDTIPMFEIMEYLKGGKDPYSDTKKYEPLSEEEWKQKR
jgi:hypothetical protein